jgi:transposase
VVKLVRHRGVHENVLRKWVKDRQANPRQAFPGQSQAKSEQAELDRLRREVAKLMAARDS